MLAAVHNKPPSSNYYSDLLKTKIDEFGLKWVISHAPKATIKSTNDDSCVFVTHYFGTHLTIMLTYILLCFVIVVESNTIR